MQKLLYVELSGTLKGTAATPAISYVHTEEQTTAIIDQEFSEKEVNLSVSHLD